MVVVVVVEVVVVVAVVRIAVVMRGPAQSRAATAFIPKY